MSVFKAEFNNASTFKAEFQTTDQMSADFGNVQVVETADYNKLANKPSYNGVIWEGEKSFEDMGDYNLTNLQIKAIFDRVFKGGN